MIIDTDTEPSYRPELLQSILKDISAASMHVDCICQSFLRHFLYEMLHDKSPLLPEPCPPSVIENVDQVTQLPSDVCRLITSNLVTNDFLTRREAMTKEAPRRNLGSFNLLRNQGSFNLL